MSVPEPFKFRNVRPIVGVFVLGAIALALAGIVAVGRAHDWFEGSEVVVARFPGDLASDIAPKTPVRMASARVGEVDEVTSEGGATLVTMRLYRSARAQLRGASQAYLRLPLGGVVGERRIELTRSSASGPLPEGAVLPGIVAPDVLADAQQLLRHVDQLVVQRAGPTLDRVDALLTELETAHAGRHAGQALEATSALLRDAREHRVLAKAAGAVNDVRALVAQVRAGKGTAGKVLVDDELYGRAVAVLARLEGALTEVARLTGIATDMARDAAALTARARSRSDDLETILGATETLVLRANRTLDRVERHWLLGGGSAADAPPPPPAVLDRGVATEPAR